MICPHCSQDTDKFTTSKVTVVRDDQNRTITWAEIIKDQAGKQLTKRVDEYSYYPTGEVHFIVMNVFSEKALISSTSVEHFTDGRQPVSTTTTHPVH